MNLETTKKKPWQMEPGSLENGASNKWHDQTPNKKKHYAPKRTLWAAKRRPTNLGLPPCCGSGRPKSQNDAENTPRRPWDFRSFVLQCFLQISEGCWIDFAKMFHALFFQFLCRFVHFPSVGCHKNRDWFEYHARPYNVPRWLRRWQSCSHASAGDLLLLLAHIEMKTLNSC